MEMEREAREWEERQRGRAEAREAAERAAREEMVGRDEDVEMS